MRRNLRLIIDVLLVALFCSLRVDEVMADENPAQTVQAAQPTRTDSSDQDSLVLVYVTLMSAAFNERGACGLRAH